MIGLNGSTPFRCGFGYRDDGKGMQRAVDDPFLNGRVDGRAEMLLGRFFPFPRSSREVRL